MPCVMHKTIFITGASSGLGKATAQLFHAKGWHVIATMRQPDQATELRQLPGVTLLPLDVTDPAQITETVAQALALHPVDVVFNNAGYGLSGPLEGTSDEQLTRQLNTNLLGVIRVAKARAIYHYDFDWRLDWLSLLLGVSCGEVGLGRLDGEYVV